MEQPNEQLSELQEWTAPQANVSLVSQLTQGGGGSDSDSGFFDGPPIS